MRIKLELLDEKSRQYSKFLFKGAGGERGLGLGCDHHSHRQRFTPNNFYLLRDCWTNTLKTQLHCIMPLQLDPTFHTYIFNLNYSKWNRVHLFKVQLPFSPLSPHFLSSPSSHFWQFKSAKALQNNLFEQANFQKLHLIWVWTTNLPKDQR